MKFFTSFEIFRAVFLSAITGLIFGAVYIASERIIFWIHRIIYLVPNTIKSIPQFSLSEIIRKNKNKPAVKYSQISKNIHEGILFFLFGLAFILLLYIALDGLFRLYVLLIVVIFSLISVKSIGKLIARSLECFFSAVYAFLYRLLLVIFYPFYRLLSRILKLIRRACIPIKKRRLLKLSQKITKRKFMETDKAFS